MASELARHGVPVRLIDQAPTPANTSRALVVMLRAREIFDDMGMVDATLAAGNRAPGISFTSGGDKKVYMDFGDLLTGSRNHHRLGAAHPVADRHGAAARRGARPAGIDFERGVALTDLTRGADIVTESLQATEGTTETAPYR